MNYGEDARRDVRIGKKSPSKGEAEADIDVARRHVVTEHDPSFRRNVLGGKVGSFYRVVIKHNWWSCEAV
jgi:hypothetical protein